MTNHFPGSILKLIIVFREVFIMYIASKERYTTMEYNRCGDSGLMLPKVSLGLWHNFGDTANFENIRQLCYKVCSLLFWRYVLQHCHFYRSFLPTESKGHTGRICPSLLPQQRGNPRHCYHPEPLWRCRYGTSYDHSKRSSL